MTFSLSQLPKLIANRFPLTHWRGDFAGGLSAGIVAIPLALAFGSQSGMGAVAGLYGAIAVGFIASVFGGTPTQISGPTGPMVVIAAMVVGDAMEQAHGLDAALPLILATFMLSGVFQMLFGFMRIGKYIRYIPYPVISGFMTGIGIIIILLQVFPILGKESPKGVINIVANLPSAFTGYNIDAIILAFATLCVIYMFPKITRSVPNILVALVVVSFMAVWTGFNVTLIGEIPSKLPDFQLGKILDLNPVHLQHIYIPAITLALLGSIDSLLTSVIADNVTKTRHDSNQELVGQGLGNIAASLIGGIPGAGTTMSTLVNTNSGARTRLSGVVHGVSLTLVLSLAGPWAEQIPVPVLAAILLTVGIGIIDYKGLKHIKFLPRQEIFVMGLVLFMTVFADLIQAVAVGMVFSSFLFMKKMGDLAEHQTVVETVSAFTGTRMKKVEEDVQFPPEIADFIFIKKLSGPLFFGFATAFQDIAKKLQDVPILILKMNDVPYCDQTGLYAMEEVVLDLKNKGVAVFIVGLQEQPHFMLTMIEIIPSLVPEEFLFDNLNQCAQFLSEKEHLQHLD